MIGLLPFDVLRPAKWMESKRCGFLTWQPQFGDYQFHQELKAGVAANDWPVGGKEKRRPPALEAKGDQP